MTSMQRRMPEHAARRGRAARAASTPYYTTVWYKLKSPTRPKSFPPSPRPIAPFASADPKTLTRADSAASQSSYRSFPIRLHDPYVCFYIIMNLVVSIVVTCPPSDELAARWALSRAHRVPVRIQTGGVRRLRWTRTGSSRDSRTIAFHSFPRAAACSCARSSGTSSAVGGEPRQSRRGVGGGSGGGDGELAAEAGARVAGCATGGESARQIGRPRVRCSRSAARTTCAAVDAAMVGLDEPRPYSRSGAGRCRCLRGVGGVGQPQCAVVSGGCDKVLARVGH